MAANKDFVIEQGRTFAQLLRWEAPPIIYTPITAIAQQAPALITVPAHPLVDGWRVAVVSVKGMVQINAASMPPKAKDYHTATVVDANTIELNDVNAADFKPYTSGGYLQSNTAVDLAGFTARMSIKDKVGGTVLASTEAVFTPVDIITIAIDNVAKTITINIDAADTEALTWKRGVYDLEMVSGTEVTALLTGVVTVAQEVTTPT